MNEPLDIRWPVIAGGSIPLDHRYVLMSSLARIAPAVHRETEIGVQAIRGVPIGRNRLRLDRNATLAIRAPASMVPDLLPLSGKRLDLAGDVLRLGTPHVAALRPAPALMAPLATIKGFMEPEPFAEAVWRQLLALEVGRQARLTVGSRRVFRIKGRTIVGFAIRLAELTPTESLLIQRHGIGGRRHLGCGIFNPARED